MSKAAPKLRVFEAFAMKHGARLGPVAVQQAGGEGADVTRGFSLVALEAIEANQELLKIPASLFFPYSSPAALANAESNTALLGAVKAVTSGRENFVASVCMAINQVVHADSGDPYLDMLFEHAGMEHHVLCVEEGDARLAALAGTSVGHEVDMRRRLFDSFGTVLGSDTGTRRRFMQSMALITSRGISGTGFPMSLCPVLDFANHSFQPNAAYACRQDEMSFELTATRPISKGEEVCISYGATRDAASFMSCYSFSPGPSTTDYVLVGGERVVVDELLRWKKHQSSPMHTHIATLGPDSLGLLLRETEQGLEARRRVQRVGAGLEDAALAGAWFKDAAQIRHRECTALEEIQRSIQLRL